MLTNSKFHPGFQGITISSSKPSKDSSAAAGPLLSSAVPSSSDWLPMRPARCLPWWAQHQLPKSVCRLLIHLASLVNPQGHQGLSGG